MSDKPTDKKPEGGETKSKDKTKDKTKSKTKGKGKKRGDGIGESFVSMFELCGGVEWTAPPRLHRCRMRWLDLTRLGHPSTDGITENPMSKS